MLKHLNFVCAFALLLATLASCASTAAAPAPMLATAAPAPTSTPRATAAAPTAVPAPVQAAAPTKTATPAPPSPTPIPPTATPAPINGALALPRGSVQQRPFAVMIDNHPNAYPQTGLNQATVVFEALAEFGLTRYMAIYVPGISPSVDEIGPVRSARPYFVEWAKGLRAMYVHAGGSPEGLLRAETSIEILNMDALRRDAGASFRRSSARSAPHNLYTNSANIAAFRDAKQAETPDLSELGFVLKLDADPAKRPASQSLSYFFIYRESYVGWSYEPATNEYLYFRAARRHLDARSGEQVHVKNLIVMEVPERPIPGDSKGRIEQLVLGEGRARIFRDGTMVEAVWRKAAGFAQLQFFTADGAEVALNAGSVWIAAIPSLENLKVEGGL